MNELTDCQKSTLLKYLDQEYIHHVYSMGKQGSVNLYGHYRYGNHHATIGNLIKRGFLTKIEGTLGYQLTNEGRDIAIQEQLIEATLELQNPFTV